MQTQKRANPEAEIQIAVIKYCLYKNIPVLHYAAERKCSIQLGMLLRRLGVRAGVSDLMFLNPDNYPVAWLELKAGKNKPTKLQLAFIKEVKSYGHFADWVNNLDAAIAIVDELHNVSRGTFF
jgi:hypothetical protein